MHTVWIIFLAAIGACVGSFLNVVIHRLPRGQSIVFPPSHCPQCGRRIKWYDNIPLVSWLALRARCRFCGVRISPRYILVEGATALLVAGLYVCYYVLDIREGAGRFEDTWPMFLSHAALLCGLLACTMVDIERWIVPLEVCWFVTLVALAANAAAPHAWLPAISPTSGAIGLAAAVGLILANVAAHFGLIQRSFIDAEDKPLPAPPPKEDKARRGKKSKADKKAKPAPPAVATTSEHGVNPRKEVLREVLFLAPAFILAGGAWALVTYVPAAGNAWRSAVAHGPLAPHINGLLAGLLGYLVGGLWVWGARILGTLAFGKEAMGLGDVHILAAVGAAGGWLVPSVAFFVAPLFGLVWALYLLVARNQRELPYGPWLALATLVVLLFYDAFATLLEPYLAALGC